MIDTEITPIDNIKALYKQVGNKVRFITALSEVVGRRPMTIQNHWFRGFWNVPKDEEQRVISFMQNYINNLNSKKSV